MIALFARRPTQIGSRGDAFLSKFWGSRRLCWNERKWTRQHVRQHAQTAVQDPFRADRPD
jgi:hypothetical protein